MKEALRYLNNAREILKSVPIENGTYADIKPVREACGVAYLAILIAIDEYLLKKAVSKKSFQSRWMHIENRCKNIWRSTTKNY